MVKGAIVTLCLVRRTAEEGERSSIVLITAPIALFLASVVSTRGGLAGESQSDGFRGDALGVGKSGLPLSSPGHVVRLSR